MASPRGLTTASHRESLLSDVRSDHTVLYEHNLSNQVVRGFTRLYLNRATGKLTSLLNKPRLKSTDALHGEQAEPVDDEFKLHAVTKIKRHEREREIIDSRPMRVGWREKLAHAQVQRGLEERKAAEGRKRQSSAASEAARAAMKRRGRDSSESDDESHEAAEKERERRALEQHESDRAKAAATPLPSQHSTSDLFLAPEPEQVKILTENAHRIKTMIDQHQHSKPMTIQKEPTQTNVHKRVHTRFLSTNGATQALQERERERGMRKHHHSLGGDELDVIDDDSNDDSGSHRLHTPPRSSSSHRLRSSASTPALSTLGRHRAPRDSADRWKHANGLHPTDMSSTAATTLKMIPKLPVHQGLAAEDVRFTLNEQPPLFVDTHTALEIACAHVHFYHFKSRHKQAHYLLLSPDCNYLLLVTFWWIFCTYFQSSQREPSTPEILETLVKNMGKKYQEFVRYVKIHLALKPSQRLNSWYDQFSKGGGSEWNQTIGGRMSGTNMNLNNNNNNTKDDLPSDRSGASVTTATATAAAASPSPSGHQRTTSTMSHISSVSNPVHSPLLRRSDSSHLFQPPFDPFTCVPDYPPQLFSDAMDHELHPKTRSGVHHQKERFLFLLPFILSAACYELCYAFFPESSHFLTKSFRQRLDGDLHHLFNGVRLSEITLVKQREKFMRDGGGETSSQTTATTTMANSSTSPSDDTNLPIEKATFESLFAFNAQVNTSAVKAGSKFHAALLNPTHSSIPGSPWITASAKRLAANTATTQPTPLTRHTRIGGVLEESISTFTLTGIDSESDGGDHDDDDGATATLSPHHRMHSNSASQSSLSPGFLSPPGVGVAAPHTKSSPGAHTRTGSIGPVITSDRAFNFGVGAAAASAAVIADRVAAFSPAPAPSKSQPFSPSIDLHGGSAHGVIDPSHQLALEEKLRRRAREKPVKGSLHSTGDWSRDERERRDFLQRMKKRHAALEKETAKERQRIALRERRIEEGSGTDANEGDINGVNIDDEYDDDDTFDDSEHAVDEKEEKQRFETGSSNHGETDPIAIAFRSVMNRSIESVPSSIAPTIAASGKKKMTPGRSLSKSASTPVLSTGSIPIGLSTPPRVLSGRSVGLVSPASSSTMSRPSSLTKLRPAALLIPTPTPHAAGHQILTSATESVKKRKPLDQYLSQQMTVDPEAADGFTASDLVLPLQSMLLTEENLRHAQQLRPPQVKLNLNSLSVATGKSLGMRAATSSWGGGIILKHSNPIPRPQLGENLQDGFAYVPKPSALAMNSIEYSSNHDAQESQARLLAAYKGLHQLQLQESKLRGAHAGANLENGEIQRGVPMRRTPSKAKMKVYASETTPVHEVIITEPNETNSTPATPAPIHAHAQAQIQPSSTARTLTFSTPLASHAMTKSTPLLPSVTAVSLSIPVVPVAAPASPPKPSVRRGPLKATSKLDALLSESKQVHWTSAPDNPDVFLTPRTKQILAQVESNAAAAAEAEQQQREQRMREQELNNEQ